MKLFEEFISDINTSLNEKAAMKILNVSDNRFNYRVEAEDFNRIEQGYLPRKIVASGAGAILQGKEEYYDDVTRNSFAPTYELKKKYRNIIFKGLTHQFPFESIFDENGMNKGFGNYIKINKNN